MTAGDRNSTALRSRRRLPDTSGRAAPEERVAMITGAGRNIGRAVALDLASAGADIVIVVRRSREEAGRVADEVRALGRRALVGVADVRDQEAIRGVVEGAREELGPVNVLVNNAAVRREAPFLELPPEEWREVVDIILDGAFVCSRAVLADMLEIGWGRIVNIAGLTAQTGAAYRAHVVAGKAGLIGLTKALSLEYAPHGITVNAVAPGMIDTVREGPEPQHHRGRSSPVGRRGKPEEVAAMVRYLVSEEAAYVTGQTFNVNGGLYL
jgi:3-oxoacyl-[acyl-carrier protein] reductase